MTAKLSTRQEAQFTDLSGGLDATSPGGFSDLKCVRFDRTGTLRKSLGWVRAVTSGWNLDTRRLWGVSQLVKQDNTIQDFLIKQTSDYACTLYSYTNANAASSVQPGLPLFLTNCLFQRTDWCAYIGLDPAQGQGTASVIANETTVTIGGGGSVHPVYGIAAGYYWRPENHHRWYQIATITDVTHFELADVYEGPGNLSAGAYTICPPGLKYDGTTVSRVGLTTPAACTGTGTGTGGNLTATDEYRFRYAYADRNTGQIGEYSAYVAVTVGSLKNEINLAGVTAGGGAFLAGNVTDRMICFDKSPLGAGFSGVYKLLLPAGQAYSLQDNSTTDFDHTDSANETSIPIEDYHNAPEVPIKQFCEHTGHMLAVSDEPWPNRIFISRNNSFESFPGARPENELSDYEKWWIDVGAEQGDKIMQVVRYKGGSVVFKEYALWLLAGNHVTTYEDADGNTLMDTDFRIDRMCPALNVGLAARDALVVLENEIVFLSHQGLYSLPGIGCPRKVTTKLNNLIRRMNHSYLYLATAGRNPHTDELYFSFPIDDATTNNVTVCLHRNGAGWEASLIPRGWGCLEEVLTSGGPSLRAASVQTGVVCDMSQSVTQEANLITGTVTSGTASSLTATAAFGSYITNFKLAGQTVGLLKSTSFQVREITTNTADVLTVTPDWTAEHLPANGDSYYVGGIPLIVRFPAFSGEPAEGDLRKRFMRVAIVFGDELVTAGGEAYLFYLTDDAPAFRAADAQETTGWTGRLDDAAVATNRVEFNLPASRGRVLEVCLVVPDGDDCSVQSIHYWYMREFGE